MSHITDVVLMISSCFDGDGEIVAAEINKYIIAKDHLPLNVSDDIGGGEKTMTSTLLIGAFNSFDVDGFRDFLRETDWNALPCGAVALAYIKEDDEYWNAVSIRKDPLA